MITDATSPKTLHGIIGLFVAVALGTIVAGTVLTGGPLLAHALFLRPAVLEVERWTAYEYAVESCNDNILDFRLNLRGRAGWQVLSARRATGEDGAGRYEFVLCRPMAAQKADDIWQANFKLKQLQLEESIARLKVLNGQ